MCEFLYIYHLALLRFKLSVRHATLTQTRINTHALLYHWPGTDSSLKPILLTAHQDVVPVEPNTVDSWIHPPYSGLYDGTWVWGRGSLDDKSGLVGIMVTLEKLIEKGFKPKRGILVGFGIDEEASGLYVSLFLCFTLLVILTAHRRALKTLLSILRKHTARTACPS